MELLIADDVIDLRVAVLEIRGLKIAPSDERLTAYRRSIVAAVQQQGPAGGEPRREAVRKMLRYGGFKPSGRSKPAQEYLLRAAREQQALPDINNAVDLMNCVSLASGLPISLLGRARFSDSLRVRYGRAGEAFVFNSAGQQLDLAGLLCICREDESGSQPLGTPVKDSLLGKINDADQDVIAVIYAPQSLVSEAELDEQAQGLAAGMRAYCGAQGTTVGLQASSRRSPDSHA